MYAGCSATGSSTLMAFDTAIHMQDIKFHSATEPDLPAIEALLADCHLPTDGIARLSENCLVAKIGSKIVGTVAMEPCGQSALFRSLAVAPACRGKSLGRSLSARMVSHARLLGIERLYLLTTDAERYFFKLGFKRTERSKAPAQIQSTSQFHSLCPMSAVCMTRDISGEAIHASAELLRLRPDVDAWSPVMRK